jgi:serine/threonine-protein kinase
MTKKLIVLAGPDEGHIFPLGTESVLAGRSRATLVHLTDPHVSRVHCQILSEGNDHVLVDFDSVSGTFVNGKEIDRHVLQTGDLVRIGATHMQYVVDADAAAAAPEKPKKASPTAWAQKLVGESISHYHITAPLAGGKTGYIFHAQDTRSDTAVALKVLHPDFAQDEKKVKHFVEAMKTVMPLGHPHLLKILGAGKTGDHCWLATEYVPGDSLAGVISRIEKTNLDWKATVRIGVYLARALEFAHGHGLVHQNVTPQNILVGRKPQNTKLTDLMLALATEEDPTKPISAAGLPSDSLPYMSPERTDGKGAKIDGRTDIYSLAATMYAVLTGKPPLQADTVGLLIEKIRLDSPPRLAAYHKVDVPQELETLLRRCMAKRLQDRPATAADMRKELEKIAHEHKITI